MNFKKPVMIAALTMAALFTTAAQATSPTPPSEPGYEQQAASAAQLLHKAVAAYREEGSAAFARFSRQGEFVDGDQYVYVVDENGYMLASGGPSAALIGRDIRPLLDPKLQEAFASALQQPDSDSVSSAEYRWMNWNDGKVERKHVFYQKVDGKTFAVGYYLPRSSEAAAKALLDDAAAAIEADPSATINRINRLDPEFNRDDLYVFVVDMDSMSMVAHGYSRRLLNIHFPELKNRDGARVGEQILDAVEAGQDSVTYSWPNPVTERPEEKKTLIRKVGNYLVAVGYYQEPVTE
ncbi:cache domain-containing protein [Pseudomonas sp.]|uniref:cache domain-containing protein n=1 Tax=Pseudomonas sp. TaxID=306 RepID=UPI003241E338